MDFKWNKLFIISILEISLVLTSCKKESDTVISIPASETITIDSSVAYKEPFRPQFHFSSEKNDSFVNNQNH